MLISEQKQFIFVQVPKTAGSAIVQALSRHAHCNPQTQASRLLRRVPVRVCWRWTHFRHHESMRDIQRHLPDSLFNRCFRFGFVRNPFDWLVSLYEYQRQSQQHRHHDLVSRMSFTAYIDYEIGRNRRHQWPLLCDHQQNFLVHYAGRYERLEEDFREICRRLGIPPVQLPVVNTSVRKDYREYYAKATRALVEQHWQDDLRLFGYGFDASGNAGPQLGHKQDARLGLGAPGRTPTRP